MKFFNSIKFIDFEVIVNIFKSHYSFWSSRSEAHINYGPKTIEVEKTECKCEAFLFKECTSSLI